MKIRIPLVVVEQQFRRIGETADKISAAAVSVERAAQAWRGASRNMRWWRAAAWMDLFGKGS